MTPKVRKEPVSVCLVAVPETTPATLYGLYEVLQSVGVVWADLIGETSDAPRFDVRIVSPDGRPFVSAFGAPVSPHAAMADVARCDIAIVTDVAVMPGSDPHGRWPESAAWIRRQYETGATVCSICTGTILVAESGVLDGVEATTHWGVASLFRKYYPEVDLHPERILSHGGPDQRVVTGGGSASWEDMALYLIARFSGEAEAVRVAKIYVFGDRSEGQLPYATMRRPDRSEDAIVATAQGWIAEHYAVSNPVARMVARSGLAERTFKRRFKLATGYAPVDYVQTVRVEEAKQMLEVTSDPTDAIAHAVGYEDPAFFRRLFKRKTGVTPARYRQRFQSIGRSVTSRPASPDSGR